MNASLVTLDLRDEIARSPEPWEPLSKVVWTASQLQPIQSLLLITSFEPVLLIRVLASMGFFHASELTADGAWNVSFARTAEMVGVGQGVMTASSARPGLPRAMDVDARGLKPTPPLVKIIGALLQLPGPLELRVLSDERPEEVRCCAELKGLSITSAALADGSHLTRIKTPAV